ncbi:MAG: DUF1559 domain-containing protein [Pirellulaceae bacterium]|nr:DUF1559 domain-containing protein [Pirellulaceae bacterium]
MRVSVWHAALTTSMLSVAMFACSSVAQENAGGALAAEAAKYLPEESIGTVTFWPARTMSLPRFRLAPLEVVTASGMEQVGIDPLKIQRVDVMLPLPGPAGMQFGAVLQMAEPVRLNDLHPQVFGANEEQDEKGFKYRMMDGPPNPEVILHQAGPKTILLGTKIFVKRMVTQRRAPTSLTTTLTSVAAGQDALVLLSIKTLRPVIEGGIDSMQGQLPPELAGDLKVVTASTDFMALRLTLDKGEKLQLMASANDDAAAAAMEKSLMNLIAFSKAMIVEQAKAAIPEDGSATSAATHKYVDRVSTEISGMLTPKRNSKRIVLEVEGLENTATIGTLVGLLLPAVQAARQAAMRMDSSNNLKQLGLAMHNYESAYRSFPATAILERDTGKPLLSWRVAILPFIEQAALYNQFHLDEPWDSPHNIKLLDMMPVTYQSKSKKVKPGHTVYVAPVNEETLLRKDELAKFRDITDGTSNTIMLIEAGEEAAVPWTKPDDLDVDLENMAEVIAKLKNETGPQIFQACFGDGSVRAIDINIDLELLKALLTRAGGEVVGNF